MTSSSYIIAIAGASCSGKTTLAEALRDKLSDAVVFGFDSYYRDFSGVSHLDINVDVPEALDNDLAASHLRQLQAGNPVEMPIYDYATHSRSARTTLIEPAANIIVEGLFTLYWEDIREMTDFAVFIDTNPDVCRARRIVRDIRERGRDKASVIHQLDHKVVPMYEKHVVPTRGHADLILDGTDPIDTMVVRVLRLITGER